MDWKKHKIECVNLNIQKKDKKKFCDRLLLILRLFFMNYPGERIVADRYCYQIELECDPAQFLNSSALPLYRSSVLSAHPRGDLSTGPLGQLSARFPRDLVVSYRFLGKEVCAVLAVIEELWWRTLPTPLPAGGLFVFQQQWAVSTDTVIMTSSPSSCLVVIMYAAPMAALCHLDVYTNACAVVKKMLAEFKSAKPAVTIIGGKKDDLSSVTQGLKIYKFLTENGIENIDDKMFSRMPNKEQIGYGCISVNPKSGDIEIEKEHPTVETIQKRQNYLVRKLVLDRADFPFAFHFDTYFAHRVTSTAFIEKAL